MIYITLIDRQNGFKLAAKDFETSEYHQDTWNHYLMIRFVSADIPCNCILDLELGVRPYIHIWPRIRVYEKIRLHTQMW